MTAIGRELTSVIINATGGFFIGTVSNAITPSATTVTDENWIRVLIEAAAQLTLDGTIAAAWFDFASRRGFAGSSMSIPFIMSLFACETGLRTKLEGLSAHFASKLNDWIVPTQKNSPNDIKSVREGQTMKYA